VTQEERKRIEDRIVEIQRLLAILNALDHVTTATTASERKQLEDELRQCRADLAQLDSFGL
jgi:hypothetical protein